MKGKGKFDFSYARWWGEIEIAIFQIESEGNNVYSQRYKMGDVTFTLYNSEDILKIISKYIISLFEQNQMDEAWIALESNADDLLKRKYFVDYFDERKKSIDYINRNL